jgi:hypothetical protein
LRGLMPARLLGRADPYVRADHQRRAGPHRPRAPAR